MNTYSLSGSSTVVGATQLQIQYGEMTLANASGALATKTAQDIAIDAGYVLVGDSVAVKAEKMKKFNLHAVDVINPTASGQALTIQIGDSAPVAVGNRWTTEITTDGVEPNLLRADLAKSYNNLTIAVPDTTIGATSAGVPPVFDQATGAMLRYGLDCGRSSSVRATKLGKSY